MTNLRGAMMASVSVAFLSTFFLYISYVQSVFAQNPIVEAASIEHTEETIELVVIDDTEADEERQAVTTEPTIETPDSDVMPNENIEIIEVELINTQESPRLPEVEISSPDTEPNIDAVNNTKDISALISEKVVEEIHLRSNVARLKRDVTALVFDDVLAELASRRSEDMAQKEYFSHTSPDGCGLSCNFESSGYETLVWGENIAKYQPYNDTTKTVIAEIFVEKWLKSSAHRDNLLSDKFTHHGIGVSVVDEEIIVTVIFASPEGV